MDGGQKTPIQSSLGVDADGARSAFVDNENYVVDEGASHAARMWPLFIPRAKTPDWFPEFVESIAM